MAQKHRKSSGTQSKNTKVIDIYDNGDFPYPKVKGVFRQDGIWLCSMTYRGKRKRLSCGEGIEGYEKAVELRKKFEKYRLEKKMKDFLSFK